jgi:hypothetical protein
LKELARRARGAGESGLKVEPWHLLLTWLESGEHRVVVPFAEGLADLVPPVAIRLRRDFGQFLVLVQAHALLHRALRDLDGEGRIVATLDDYDEVRDIVAPIVADAAEATINKTIRETVDAVAALTVDHPNGVPVTALARQLDIDKAAASRRWTRAKDRGFLRNEEDRPGRPARLKLGDPLPEDTGILPTRAEIEGKSVAPLIEVNGSTVVENGSTVEGGSTVETDFDQGERRTVDPLTHEKGTRETVDLASSTVPARSMGARTAGAGAAPEQGPCVLLPDAHVKGIAFARSRYQEGERNMFALTREMNDLGYRRKDGHLWTAATLADVLGIEWR